MDFGAKVKTLRKALGMTQTELANKCGYTHKSAICKIEQGRADIPFDKINIMAQALQTTPEYLTGFDAILKNEGEEALADKVAELLLRPVAFEAFDLFMQLDIDQQQQALAFIKFLLNSKKTPDQTI